MFLAASKKKKKRIKVTSPLADECLNKVAAVLLTSIKITVDQDKHPELDSVPQVLWAKDKYDVGTLQTPPVQIKVKPGAVLPRLPQYPVSSQQIDGIRAQIEAYETIGVLVKMRSPVNCPLFPVKKKVEKGKPPVYRLVHDLRAVNKIIEADAPVVPNPHTILSQIPETAAWFTVVDLANADCYYLFSFTFEGVQRCWTRLAQGGVNSPTIYNQVLHEVLEGWKPIHENTVLQSYVDDLMLCCDSEEQCKDDTVRLLCYLAETGNKASKDKLQYCKS